MRKSIMKSKFYKTVFITITVLIAIGLVVPLAGLFQNDPGSGAQGDGTSGQSLQDRLTSLEARAKESPRDTSLLMDLAETYRYASKTEQAIMTYSQVLEIDPGNTEASIEIALIYFYSGKNDQAIAQLQEVLKKDPDNKTAHYLYGIVLGAGKKDYAAGIQELEKFITLAREGPDVEKAKQIINEWKAVPAQK